MTNPKSRHAVGNSSTPKVLGPQTGMPLGDKLGFPIIPPKKPTAIPKQPVDTKTKVIKTKEEIKILNRVAVEQIFKSYWYGWENGHPPFFDELFKDYGNFVHFSVKPSSMIGSPDTHLSTINSSGHKAFAIYVTIHEVEGKATVMRKLQESSPSLASILFGIAQSDAMAILENNGKNYTFTKMPKGNGDVYTYDDNGYTRLIPRWAIA